MTALYELGNAREILEKWLEETEGEVTPTLDVLLADWDADWAWKAERVALFAIELTKDAEAAKEERDRLAAIAKSRENRAAEVKAYLHREMDRVGKTTVKGKVATIALQKNPPSVKGELSPEQLEALYHNGPAIVRHAPESFTLDRKACLDAFKAGATLPDGLTVEQSLSLRIR